MLEILTLSSLVKVFSDETPKAVKFNRLSMFRNEKAALQVAVKSDTDTEIAVSVLSDETSAARVSAVEEVYSGFSSPIYCDDNLLRKGEGYFPELLRPISGNVFLPADKWQSFWVEIVPDGLLQAGEKKVVLGFEEGGVQRTAELYFDVIDAELPPQKLIYTNWLHTDCLATHYGVEVFSERYWEITENFLKTACDYGMNMVLTPIFTPPLDTEIGKERPTVQLVGVKKTGGNYSFDFTNLDRWIELCRKVGIKYFEFSHLATQWGAKKCPKIVAEVDGVRKRIFGWDTKASGREYREFLTAFAAAFKPYIYAQGIENDIYFHVSDEPMPRVIRSYRKAASLVSELFGEFHMIDALSDFKFYKKGLIKLPIPANDHIEPFIGKVPELWTYYCSVQVKGVSNRFFSMPSHRNRIIGYQMYKFGVKGFLHWGYNFYYTRYSKRPVDPFKETDAGKRFASGDSFVVYPAVDGTPLRSLRLSVFNDGLQDMRALELLESLVGREKTMEILETDAGKPLTFSEYPKSDSWHLARREAVNEAIRTAIGK